jgi:hypothetical protein
MAEDTHGDESRHHRSHRPHGGTELDEATPERRERWKKELESQGKYKPGASLKELIAERDGMKSGAEAD